MGSGKSPGGQEQPQKWGEEGTPVRTTARLSLGQAFSLGELGEQCLALGLALQKTSLCVTQG